MLLSALSYYSVCLAAVQPSRVSSTIMGGSISVCIAVLLFLGLAACQQAQLETARINERDQRREFPLTGDGSAFKFRFPAVVSQVREPRHKVTKLAVKNVHTNENILARPASVRSWYNSYFWSCWLPAPTNPCLGCINELSFGTSKLNYDDLDDLHLLM